jgi:hypothetical protein
VWPGAYGCAVSRKKRETTGICLQTAPHQDGTIESHLLGHYRNSFTWPIMRITPHVVKR